MKKNTAYFLGIGSLILFAFVFFFLIQKYLRNRQTTLFSQDSSFVSTSGVRRNENTPFIVYGYLPYWTRNKAVFSPVLTHVSYFSLGIQSDGRLLDLPKKAREPGYLAYQNDVLTSLRESIKSQQKLELTLTMMDQDAIPLFLGNISAQDAFLDDLQKIITNQPITGVNIDIEYNGVVDSELQQRLTTLLHRTKVLVKKQSSPLSLSIATYSDAGDLQRLTNLKQIEPEVDHIIMMAYDFHRSKSLSAGPNSPIYGKSLGKWGEDIMSDLQEYTQGVPSEKILLGVPFYGYAWSVEDGTNPNSFTLPKSGESVPYANIKKLLTRTDVRRYWDAEALSPYLMYTAGGKAKILYYDDPESLSYKMTLVRQANLGGIAIWAVGYDEGDEQLWDSIRKNLSY